MEPHQYSKRILLLITGLSPQVVTETLYALAVNREEVFVPTEIYVVTTAEGAERARLTLLSDEPGWFHRLCADYELSSIAFDSEHIRVLEDAKGNPLHDIRTPEENAWVADQISELVRELAQDEQAALHVSIAGGRKTMGFYLGYALSLYGRPQDRLSHVLVAPGFESHPEFFYPTPKSHVIWEQRPNGPPMDTATAGVTLADIPFVRLRDGLPEALLEGASSFSKTIEAAQRMYGPVSLQLDLQQCEIVCGNLSIELTHADMAFYAFMATRAVDGKPAICGTDKHWFEEYLQIYSKIVSPESADYERAEETYDFGKYFEQRKSKTNRALRNKLGKKASDPYLIHSFGQRPHTHFRLRIDGESICFAENTQP